MSELQAYYDAFRTGYWAHPDADRCPCHGSGWALSEVDTWHKCPIHYNGQAHPEDYEFEAPAGEVEDTIPSPPPAPASEAPTDDDIPF